MNWEQKRKPVFSLILVGEMEKGLWFKSNIRFLFNQIGQILKGERVFISSIKHRGNVLIDMPSDFCVISFVGKNFLALGWIQFLICPLPRMVFFLVLFICGNQIKPDSSSRISAVFLSKLVQNLGLSQFSSIEKPLVLKPELFHEFWFSRESFVPSWRTFIVWIHFRINKDFEQQWVLSDYFNIPKGRLDMPIGL